MKPEIIVISLDISGTKNDKWVVKISNINDLRHSLAEDRKSSCFADNQISPLYDNDGDKESSVAGQFKFFTLLVRLKIKLHIFD